MRILGLETTCDETGAAVVEGELGSKQGVKPVSNVVATSAQLQKKYGGVVPEVAAREQVRVIVPVVAEAIAHAAQITNHKSQITNNLSNPQIIKWAKENLDAVAVAHGPGLIGSLLVGVETAKTLALVLGKPLIAVNHLVGHIYANFIGENLKFKIKNLKFPMVTLVVSGGHTDLVLMKKHGDYRLLGSTLDDAAGEAFDKVAKVLGLGYPGGPEIEKLAVPSQTRFAARRARFAKGDKAKSVKSKLELPRPMIGSHDFNFSFSGLKTAVVDRVNKFNHSSNDSEKFKDHHSSRFTRTISNDFQIAIAYEFQQAVVDILVTKTVKAAQKFSAKSIVVGGGVAANSQLRDRMSEVGRKNNLMVIFPTKEMSVDNGAMIAAAAFYDFKKVDPLKLSADPSLHFH